MKLNPVIDFIRYHYRFFRKRIEFNKELNNNLTLKSHEHQFKTFLNVFHTKSKTEKLKTCAILKVTFKVRKMSFFQKKVLSILSIPFFAGAPWFISKSFMINERDNAFQGFYEWESVGAAQTYISSYPLNFMKKISTPDSVNYEILPVNAGK